MFQFKLFVNELHKPGKKFIQATSEYLIKYYEETLWDRLHILLLILREFNPLNASVTLI